MKNLILCCKRVSHHHVVVGHGCELGGALCALVRLETASMGLLFIGAAILLLTEILPKENK
jgi:hypothetical protein